MEEILIVFRSIIWLVSKLIDSTKKSLYQVKHAVSESAVCVGGACKEDCLTGYFL